VSKSDGYYSSGCSALYFHCNGGNVLDLTCPTGTKYSVQINACDYTANIPACGGRIPTTTPPAPMAFANQQPAAAPQQQYAYTTQSPPSAPIVTQPQYQQPSAPVAVQQPTYNTPAPLAPVAPVTQPQYQQPSAPVAVQQQYQQPSAPIAVQQQYQQPSAPVAVQQQYQQPSAPIAVQAAAPTTQPEDTTNNCAHLQNGIYGRKCSRHYFVCSAHKTYEFTCPSNYAYDRTLARCGPMSAIQGCTPSAPVAPSVPQYQQPSAPIAVAQPPAQPQAAYHFR